MNADQLTALLTAHDACVEACDWAAGKDLATAWRDCPRADWLLWLCARMIGQPGWPSHQDIVRAACACAETVLSSVPPGEDRPRQAIMVARAWADSRATRADVRAAAAEAHAAAAAYAASAAKAAVYTAKAAAYTAKAAAYTAHTAAKAAAFATHTAAFAAFATHTPSAAAKAAQSSHARLAALVRSQLTIPM